MFVSLLCVCASGQGVCGGRSGQVGVDRVVTSQKVAKGETEREGETRRTESQRDADGDSQCGHV